MALNVASHLGKIQSLIIARGFMVLVSVILVFVKLAFFAMLLLINAMCDIVQDVETIFEPRHEKTGFLHMRKQRRRSASR